MAKDSEVRYMLPIARGVYDELMRLKEERNTSLKAVIHQVLKVGLYAMRVAETPGKALLVEENGEIRKLIFL